MLVKNSTVTEEYRIAATEVLCILKHFPKSETDKIPNKFKDFLKENSASDYNPHFDFSLGLDNIELKHKTKLLLAMIYRNYLCSEEERLEYDKILYENEEKYQNDLREKYNPENIFKQVDNYENGNVEISNNALIEYKESFFMKLKKRIFKILHIE